MGPRHWSNTVSLAGKFNLQPLLLGLVYSWSLSNLSWTVSFRFASVRRVSRASSSSSPSSPHVDLLSYIKASLDKLEGKLIVILNLTYIFYNWRETSLCVVVNKVWK